MLHVWAKIKITPVTKRPSEHSDCLQKLYNVTIVVTCSSTQNSLFKQNIYCNEYISWHCMNLQVTIIVTLLTFRKQWCTEGTRTNSTSKRKKKEEKTCNLLQWSTEQDDYPIIYIQCKKASKECNDIPSSMDIIDVHASKWSVKQKKTKIQILYKRMISYIFIRIINKY